MSPRLALNEQREKAATKSIPVEGRWLREQELEELQLGIAQLIEAEKAKNITVSTLLQLLPDKERERDALKLERARF